MTIERDPDQSHVGRERYHWDEWFDGDEHLIKLGPGTEWPKISARSVGVAARFAADKLGLTVHSISSPDKTSIRIWAERPGGSARAFDWDTWFDGNLHKLDCESGGYWQGISPASLQSKIVVEAKIRRLEVNFARSEGTLLVQVVGQLPPK